MMVENEIKGAENRVVVITGGSSGIGRAMAETFAQHGDQVVIIGRHEDTLRVAAEAIGSNCSWQQADVSQNKQVTGAVNAIVPTSVFAGKKTKTVWVRELHYLYVVMHIVQYKEE